jgi:hypothetical protein
MQSTSAGDLATIMKCKSELFFDDHRLQCLRLFSLRRFPGQLEVFAPSVQNLVHRDHRYFNSFLLLISYNNY